ncbi:hypothetical protein D3C84_1315240 [compost metagenome]
MTWQFICVVHHLAMAAVDKSSVPCNCRVMQSSTKRAAMVATVSHSASLKRVFCMSMSGCPNTWRVRV